MDFDAVMEINQGLSRIKDLFDLKFWKDSNYSQSAFIEILINMKDLLIKAEKLKGQRVNFDDDVLQDEKLKVYDVTDLIKLFRDTACHTDSYKRKVGTNVFAFNTFYEKGVLMKIGDVEIESKYSDDIAFNMGMHVLYLKRHLFRAFVELQGVFADESFRW